MEKESGIQGNREERNIQVVLKAYDRLFIVAAASLVPLLTIVYFFAPKMLGYFGYGDSSVSFFRSLLTEIIPLCITFVVSYIILRKVQEIKYKEMVKDLSEAIIQKNSLKSNLITQLLHDIKQDIHSPHEFLEIEKISYSYLDTDWKYLLEDAIRADLCLFYTSTEWNIKNIQYFVQFLENGGTLNLYLPNPIGIQNRFYGSSAIHKEVVDKITRTYSNFRSRIPPHLIDKVSIKVIDKGFNFMYSRITRVDKKVFLMSPYPNNEKSDSPVILFDESSASTELKNFIEGEMAFLMDASVFHDFEKEKYIVWNKENTKVFVSTGLDCPGGCKFCYIDSLVTNPQVYDPEKMAKIICGLIKNDTRFVPGENGTTVMLGGFTDPFLPRHFPASMDIVNFFSAYGNFIHIAARYCINRINEKDLFPSSKNVVINYSISSISQNNIEVHNQIQRLKEAKKLISKGYKVALFVRPIIKDVTLSEIDSLINLAKDAGIKVVTVGGLYVDTRIKKQLEQYGVNIGQYQTFDKNFVLDDKAILKKMKIDDLSIIVEKFRDNGFHVFESSDQRIAHYRQGKNN